MPDFDSEAVAGPEDTQLLPVRAGRVLGDHLPSPPPPPTPTPTPAAGSEATAPQL